jgi:hypothetical protein
MWGAWREEASDEIYVYGVLWVRREREGKEVREAWRGGLRRGELGVVGGLGIEGMWGLGVGLGVAYAEQLEEACSSGCGRMADLYLS